MPVSLLTRTSDHTTNLSTDNTISWQAANEVGMTGWSAGSPTLFTVPVGITYLEMFFTSGQAASTPSGNGTRVRTFKNGSEYMVNLQDANPFHFGVAFSAVPVSSGNTFDMRTASFGGTALFEYEFLSWGILTPDRDGFTYGHMTSDTAITTTPSVIVWTMDFDNLLAVDSSTELVVPAGINFVVVNINSVFGSADADAITWILKKNGTAVRRYFADHSLWAAGPPSFGLLDVTPGDVLTVEAVSEGSTSLIGAATSVSFEWIAA